MIEVDTARDEVHIYCGGCAYRHGLVISTRSMPGGRQGWQALLWRIEAAGWRLTDPAHPATTDFFCRDCGKGIAPSAVDAAAAPGPAQLPLFALAQP